MCSQFRGSRWIAVVRAGLRLAMPFAVLLSVPGCSYAFVHGPPVSRGLSEAPAPPAQSRRDDCTSSNSAPVIDTVLAVPLLGAGVLSVVAAAESPESCTSWCIGPTKGEAALVAAGALALGGLFLSSAITGYGRTADCRRLELALPRGPRGSARHLLDVNAIAEARAREQREGP